MDSKIRMAEVKKHRTKDKCWVVIRNKVYDVTKFLDDHPGGFETILEVAGEDATAAFDDIGHSNDAETLLDMYLLGYLHPNDHIQPTAKKPAASNNTSDAAKEDEGCSLM